MSATTGGTHFMTAPARIPLEIDIGYPDPWIQVPIEPEVDAAEWAEQQAEVIIQRGREVDDDLQKYVRINRKQLVRELTRTVRFAQNGEASFYFVCYPPGYGSSDILLDLTQIYPEDDSTVLTLDWFEENFSHSVSGKAQIDRFDLPAGPAVRIQRIFAPRKRTWWGGKPVFYNTSYAIDAPGTDELVVLNGTWSMAGLDDVLTENIDGIAETVRVTPLT